MITATTDGKARIWDAHRETRSLAELRALQDKYVPYRLVDGRLVVTERP